MTTNRKNANALEMGDDLRITKTTRRASGGGTWVIGTIAGHRFDALVFPEHAESPDFELGDSRISKLWLQRLADSATVLHFDRGWDVRPADAAAAAVMDFLAAGLADHVYGGWPTTPRSTTMTINELIQRLEEYRDDLGGDTDVRLMTQQNWPFENEIFGLISGEEMNELEDEDHDVDTDHVVFIVEGQQRCYGSTRAWDAAH